MAPGVGSPLLWAGFTLFVLFMLVLDLGVFHRKDHTVHFREAFLWTCVWVTLALIFNAGIYFKFGGQRGLEFLTGYLIEYALSVDNIFVFVLIFKYFAIPLAFQHRILFWGILGVLVMRVVFILVGVALLSRFEWVIFLLGGFLIYAGLKMLKGGEVEVHPESNITLRMFRRFVPTVSQDYGSNLVVRREGRIYATPLLLVLVVVDVTDFVFAMDSIPAIFAVTRDPFVIFSSNIFAVLGLRSLYFLLANAMNKFHYLKWGLGLVLAFVGFKMVVSHYFVIPIGVSLAVVGGLLACSILASLLCAPAVTASDSLLQEPPSAVPPPSQE